jgi:YbgC/YbaW family acyl-CoA thioester hydrolase
MPDYFSRTFRVRWSEVRANGQVDLANYLRYLVETAWDWGAANGLSMQESENLGLAWVIRETEILFYRPLLPGDIFEFRIWLMHWRRVRGTRGFELRLKGGDELIAQGVQQVVTLDSQTMRPTPPPENMMESFLKENPRLIPQGQMPEYQLTGNAFKMAREVEWRDLDTFEHVNNATYASYAENLMIRALEAVGWSPSDFKSQDFVIKVRRFHIQHLSIATWGETIDFAADLVELKAKGGTWVLEMKRVADGQLVARCLLEWVLTNRITGKEQKLPESLFSALNKSFNLVAWNHSNQQPEH